MEKHAPDPMYLKVEHLCREYALFPPCRHRFLHETVDGLLSPAAVAAALAELDRLNLDDYIARTVQPAGEPARPGALAVIHRLGGDILRKVRQGPLVAVELNLEWNGRSRRIGIIAQERTTANGVWMPEHHLAASGLVREFANLGIPIVTFIDTPGADAGDRANRGNQAHAISRLIAEMAGIDVPTLGIILGNGYSGGAIPLAATNLLFSVRDGVFNTIHPSGLASIARKLNLSWQECARHVRVSAPELLDQGMIDGVIDFVPGEDPPGPDNLKRAILTAIDVVETEAMDLVRRTPEIFDSYRASVMRLLNPSTRLQALERRRSFLTAPGPGEHLNVFGTTFRYLRYLHLRGRIRSTTVEQYGRLAQTSSLPTGDLKQRRERQQQAAFTEWLENPDPVAYDDRLLRALKSARYWAETIRRGRGRLHTLLLGEAAPNLEWSRDHLRLLTGFHLLNRWKTDAVANFRLLLAMLETPEITRWRFTVTAVTDAPALAERILAGDGPTARAVKSRLTAEARRVLSLAADDPVSRDRLRRVLTGEFNRLLTHSGLAASAKPGGSAGAARAESNRRLLEESFPSLLRRAPASPAAVPAGEATVLDVMLDPDLRLQFMGEIRSLIVFNTLYDQLVAQLPQVAREARSEWSLSRNSVGKLLEKGIRQAIAALEPEDLDLPPGTDLETTLRPPLMEWLRRLARYPRRDHLLQSLEEWKKTAHPRMSETLFVVITDFLSRLLPQYFHAETHPDSYDGRISPRRIGRQKDFWNRLTLAYQDLLIAETLSRRKRSEKIRFDAVINRFFSEFQAMDQGIMTADPQGFPGFRQSIQASLDKGVIPCGVVTGVARFTAGDLDCRVGLMVSNLTFQAGAFDMAAAEKLCRLLTHCARHRLPVVAFVSSGGMQTKEGAGGLFPMAVVNSLISRIVRDHDLPVIMFGFGDCTGGAQASFVTHPLVHTWYFSGTNMPFAGQIVVPAHLPARSTLSNYLSRVPGAMSGLVVHPFAPGLDEELREIDPTIPVPDMTVAEVMARVLRGQEPTRDAAPATPARAPAPIYRPLRRVLLHARGCTAVRLIDQARRAGHQVVLVQSDPDMNSLPAAMLGPHDRLVCIGGNTPDESYLNAHSVLRVARMEEADSLHPGIGFLSENADFARLCLEKGLNFIGPPVTAMEAMGNKSNAIRTAVEAGVPVVPGSHGILVDSAHAERVAAEIGYPVLLKAVHGGGGKGIRVVREADHIHQAFLQIATEARNAFGNGDIYLEKYITRLRHVEVQVLRDRHGHIRVPGIRDCSVQRNNQKLIEESRSGLLPAGLEKSAREYAARLSDAIDYVGAGTVEFIFDLDGPAIYFMEMNTRLQVEHPVTEMSGGIDIVDAQFRIAAGKSLKGLKPGDKGYAVEVRINAEKPVPDSDGRLAFVPSPGTITTCRFPDDPEVRLITLAAEGRTVSPYYDSLIAQVIARGRNRNEALDRLVRWLEQVKIRGIPTNIPLLRRILSDRVFRSGEYTTAFLEDFTARTDPERLIRETMEACGTDAAATDSSALRIPDSTNLKVLSPSTGVFYLTPSPSEPEFVHVGDVIDVHRTLCLLEAMKLFSPVSLETFNTPGGTPYPPDRRYTVLRINVASGATVNAGDLLFVLQPEEPASPAELLHG